MLEKCPMLAGTQVAAANYLWFDAASAHNGYDMAVLSSSIGVNLIVMPETLGFMKSDKAGKKFRRANAILDLGAGLADVNDLVKFGKVATKYFKIAGTMASVAGPLFEIGIDLLGFTSNPVALAQEMVNKLEKDTSQCIEATLDYVDKKLMDSTLWDAQLGGVKAR